MIKVPAIDPRARAHAVSDPLEQWDDQSSKKFQSSTSKYPIMSRFSSIVAQAHVFVKPEPIRRWKYMAAALYLSFALIGSRTTETINRL